MSAKRGKLVATITLSANQTFFWTDSNGGPLQGTVAAGAYTGPEGVAAALQTAIRGLAGTVGDDATVTVSVSEASGTGKTTVTSATGSATLNWDSLTEMRDALGFAGSQTISSPSSTGTLHCKGLWLPDAVKYSKHGDSDPGRRATDLVQTIGPTGTVKSLKGRYFDVHEQIRWTGISGPRAKKHLETVTGESFEQFWRDTQLGENSLFSVGTQVTFYWDADAGTNITGKLIGHATYDPARMQEGWTGRYIVELPTLIVVGA